MINFMKFKKLYLTISGIIILISVLSLSFWQVRPSIDFVGGALLEVKFPERTDLNTEQIQTVAGSVENLDVYSIAYSNETQSFILRTNSIDEAKKAELISALNQSISTAEELRFETVGPTLGRELLVKTVIAMIIASILIMFYVAYQFKDRIYGLAAILAMLHDTLILIGVFSLLGHFLGVEVDALFVTAALTTLSFSVHDTIVVFDRIRETIRQFPNAKFHDIANKAITETMQRSLNNSMTIIFMLTALALLGGVTIKWFVVALLIGTILGTYSSPFIATPILLILMERKRKKELVIKRKKV